MKERVDELTSAKEIFVTRFPKINTFQIVGDEVSMPQTAEEWAAPEYGLEVSGKNGTDKIEVLVPGLDYYVEQDGKY
ncbi:MAG: hypothetical protein LBB47_05320 [Spirochaetaceae bacterium]|nr:hypothetical protein [Spirochaetaceae bacterium]